MSKIYVKKEALRADDDTNALAGLCVKADDTGRVLLLQRRKTSEFPVNNPGVWEFPGGHVKEGEHPIQAAIREWQEEVGRPLPEGRMEGKFQNKDYNGYIYVIPQEESVDLSKTGRGYDPDDPDGMHKQNLKWWTIKDIKSKVKRGTVRHRLHNVKWKRVKKAAFGQPVDLTLPCTMANPEYRPDGKGSYIRTFYLDRKPRRITVTECYRCGGKVYTPSARYSQRQHSYSCISDDMVKTIARNIGIGELSDHDAYHLADQMQVSRKYNAFSSDAEALRHWYNQQKEWEEKYPDHTYNCEATEDYSPFQDMGIVEGSNTWYDR